MSDRARSIGRSQQDTPVEPEHLIRRVAAGDESAFCELYDLVVGSVLGVVTRVVRNRAQSEEVTQEVLIEVWRRAAHYSPERGSVHAWVLTIAHRRAVDRVRSEQSATDREQRVAQLEIERPFDQVAEATVAALDRERVRHCLAALTDLQRQSVVLAYYNGYTYREVADVLNSPLGTVKTRLRDGLIRMRDCLGVNR